jgi:4-hydroxy-tetrahydrodipicolinate synthase
VDLKLPGLIVPPLTPFTEDLQVDEMALRAEIDYVVDECDAAMVVAAGVETQEYTYLSMDQRKRLIRSTVELVARRRPVAVGITHPSFRTAVELAHLAQDLGADAVQLLAPLRPFGGAPTQAELVAYFEAISREFALPIVLYLNPGPGADVSIPGTVELAKLDSVRFIKESSRDLSRVAQLAAKVDLAGHARYFTTVQMLLATLELGGSGATMPPPAAELSAKVIRAFVAGKHEEAARLQRQTALFPAGWMHRGLAPTLKAAMKILGRPVGDPYPPFGHFTAEERIELARYLAKTDLIPKENR